MKINQVPSKILRQSVDAVNDDHNIIDLSPKIDQVNVNYFPKIKFK